MTKKFIDMFAGMGTVRMGFEQAGWKCVSSIEFDKHKRRIYEVIFGNEPEFGDITAVRGSDLPYADCWCFGAPCQDFSIAGIRAGLDGDRSSLVREVFRLVGETPEEHRPEWLLYENVKGMLSSNKGLDYLEILCEMGSLGYDIQWQLLNSKDFGVPQNRERVYTLGHLRTRGERKVFPIGCHDAKASDLQGQYANTITARYGAAAGSGTYIGEGQQPAQIITSHRLNSSQDGFVVSPDGISKTLTAGHFNVPKVEVKQIGNVMPTATRANPNQGRVYDPTGLAPCLNKMEGVGREPMIAYGVYPNASPEYQRPPLKNLSRTLKADGGHPAGVLQNSCIRRLTPRECMRLQGVDDAVTDKLISGGISDTQMYRAAGDACTVNVIYEIAKRL